MRPAGSRLPAGSGAGRETRAERWWRAISPAAIDAGVAEKRLMIVESEFAGALTVARRDGNILSRVLRDAWDRGDLATLTKSSPARATGAHLSLIGHITAEELRA